MGSCERLGSCVRRLLRGERIIRGTTVLRLNQLNSSSAEIMRGT